MLIENPDALKKCLIKTVDPISDADPIGLTKYILAILKKPKSEDHLKEFLLDQLEIFLEENTAQFVDELFEVIKSKSYLRVKERENMSMYENSEKDCIYDLQLKQYQESLDDNPAASEAKRANLVSEAERLENNPTASEDKRANLTSDIEIVNQELDILRQDCTHHTYSLFHGSNKLETVVSSQEGQKPSSKKVKSKKKRKSKRKKEINTGAESLNKRKCSLSISSRSSSSPPEKNELQSFKERNSGFNYHHSSLKPKRIVFEPTSTIELRRIPPEWNIISNLIKYYSSFGQIINIQLCFDEDPEASLITFATAAEATAAYKSTLLLNGLNKRSEKKNERKVDYQSCTQEFTSGDYHIKKDHSELCSKSMKSKGKKEINTGAESLKRKRSLSISSRSSSNSPEKNELQSFKKRNSGLNSSGHHSSLKPKGIVFEPANTIELRNIPPELNTISNLIIHYSSFGQITRIQLCCNDDPQAALITFATAAEATAAYKSTVLLHGPSKRSEVKNETCETKVDYQARTQEFTSRDYPIKKDHLEGNTDKTQHCYGSSTSLPDMASEASRRSETPSGYCSLSSRSSLSEDNKDCKKLYDEVRKENEILKESLKKTEEELEKTKNQLQKLSQISSSSNHEKEESKRDKKSKQEKRRGKQVVGDSQKFFHPRL